MSNIGVGLIDIGREEGLEKGRAEGRKELLAKMLSAGAINKETYEEFLNENTGQKPPVQN